MSLSLSSLTSRHHSGPPQRASNKLPKPASPQPALEDAYVRSAGKSKFIAVAAGLTLTGLALATCSGPVPPAADAGAYELEDPEVVVMSDSIQRIDLSREQELECTGFGEDEECDFEDLAYHPIGIHMGHGLVQDLNGNLFAAPQLAAAEAPGVAVRNPDSVFLDGPWGTEGNLRRVDSNTVKTEDSQFGWHTITLSSNQALVTQRGLFGSEYESMRVSYDDGVATISEGRHDQQLVQSQGDHLLTQSVYGTRLGEVRHNTAAGEYTVQTPSLGSDYQVTVTYGPDSSKLETNSWASGVRTVTRGRDEQGRETHTTRHGRWRQGTVTETETGWLEHNPGLFGGSTIEYTIRGGEQLP